MGDYKMRICIIEDEFMSELIRQLFQENKEHELIFYPDLSDEKVYKRHLPEGYDLYWFHISAIEDEAIREIKENQPWSKLIARTNSGISTDSKSLAYSSYNWLREMVDQVAPRICDEKRVMEAFGLFGVKIALPNK